MAWAATTLDSSVIAATAADVPLFVAKNVLRVPVTAKWTEGDTFAAGSSADVTEDDHPARNAVSQNPYRGTRARPNTTGVYYFLVQANVSSVFDVAALRLNWTALGSTSVTVKRADDVTGTNQATLCSFSATVPTKRLISLSLGTGNQQFSGSGFIQIALTSSSTDIPPELGGLFLGQRRVLNRKFDMPYDDDPLEIDASDFLARAGNRQRVKHDGPVALIRGQYTAVSSGSFSQDDVAALRGVYEDCRYGADPVIFVESPSTATASAPHRYWHGLIPSKLRPIHEQFGAYNFDFVFDEVKPYREPEVTG